MKKLLLSLMITMFIGFPIKAQDFIVLKTGDEVKSKVLEIGLTEIKYKKYDNLNGPSYTVTKSDVFMVRYENGTKDVISTIQSENIPGKNKIYEINESSPTSKGHILLSPGSNFSFGHTSQSDSHINANSLNLNLTAGYFIVDNLATSITLGFYYGTYDDGTGNTQTSNTINYGFQIRYYIIGKVFGGIGYSSIKPKSSDSNNYLGLIAGYAAFMTKNISIEPSINYSLELSKKANNFNTLSIDIGIGIYF